MGRSPAIIPEKTAFGIFGYKINHFFAQVRFFFVQSITAFNGSILSTRSLSANSNNKIDHIAQAPPPPLRTAKQE